MPVCTNNSNGLLVSNGEVANPNSITAPVEGFSGWASNRQNHVLSTLKHSLQANSQTRTDMAQTSDVLCKFRCIYMQVCGAAQTLWLAKSSTSQSSSKNPSSSVASKAPCGIPFRRLVVITICSCSSSASEIFVVTRSIADRGRAT
jgi:hypothetical protein